jgi:O-antigen/teichoic acid export membrane protein
VTHAHRIAVGVLLLGALLTGAALLAFASVACPTQTDLQACANAALNRAVVLAMAAGFVVLLVTPFAFLGEFAARRRSTGNGAWLRAARRGLLAGAVVAALGALRLGDALSVPVLLFVVVLAVMVEWYAVRRFDASGG